MSTLAPAPLLVVVGETAGTVWRTLSTNGPMSMTKLVQAVEQPRDVVMQALGWLAREDKISIEEDHRTRVVSLR